MSDYKSPDSLIRVAFLLCTLLLSALNSSAQGFNREVWFSTITNGVSETGTPEAPYHASTLAGKAATWASSGAGTNYTIRLYPGTYEIVGSSGLVIPYNSKLVGSGMHNTLIVPKQVTNTGDYSLVKSYNSDGLISVSDLTLNADFGGQVTNAAKSHNLIITSRHALVERVKFIGYGGKNASDEAFPCWWIGSFTNGPSTALIQNCYFEGPCRGSGYASLITASSHSSYLPTPLNATTNQSIRILNNHMINDPKSFGVNAAGANIQVDGNSFQSIFRAYYIDTGFAKSLTIRNNKAIDVVNGVFLNSNAGGSYIGTTDVLIEGNQFDLYTVSGLSGSDPVAGIRVSMHTTNLVVRDNIIQASERLRGSFKTNWYGIKIDGSNGGSIQNVALIRNAVAWELNNSMPDVVPGGVITRCSDNTIIEDSGSPDGFPPYNFIWHNSGSTLYITTSDMLKDVQTFFVSISHIYTNQLVYLPSAASCVGKRLILQFKKHTYNSYPLGLCIDGGTGTSYTAVDDPTGGSTGNFDIGSYPNVFILGLSNKFADRVQLFPSSVPGRKMEIVDLMSNGFQWIIVNK